jgi:hypothetical protein
LPSLDAGRRQRGIHICSSVTFLFFMVSLIIYTILGENMEDTGSLNRIYSELSKKLEKRWKCVFEKLLTNDMQHPCSYFSLPRKESNTP